MRNKTKIQTNRESIIDFNEENVEFTYSFNGLKVEFVDTRFAITPNDPNYNSSDNFYINDKTHKESKKIVNFKEIIYVRVPKEDTPSNSKFLSYSSLVTQNQKKFNNGPTQITSNYKIIDDIYFVSIVSGCSAAIMFAVVFMSLTWLRLQQGAKAAENIDYPAYGVTGPNKELLPSEDQRLAQSAQMYHFQHQKQQIIASEKNVRDPSSVSEIGSDEDNDEGDYTVYECPGLAPAGEIEVKNPLFIDDAIQGLTNLNSNQEDKH
ncbi:neural proliferation differentiation and control protein 1-like [Cotesia glomerata]|uniref:neural proliferation differentiation and control protein 1-like n=2 Tax=Cotesia glomerata TaxID=32391 RepID=UPI001D01DB07|nr:neural proliferation differentiation and control protein 1-like [Cotesia glomerata]